jgi:hypothetical protein
MSCLVLCDCVRWLYFESNPQMRARCESYFATVFTPQRALDTDLFIAGLAEEPVESIAPKNEQL